MLNHAARTFILFAALLGISVLIAPSDVVQASSLKGYIKTYKDPGFSNKYSVKKYSGFNRYKHKKVRRINVYRRINRERERKLAVTTKTQQGIAGTPYRKGFSDRFFKSDGFGFTTRSRQWKGYADRPFRSNGNGFGFDNPKHRDGYSDRFFRSRGIGFSDTRPPKNKFNPRAFRSTGGGFAWTRKH